MESGSRLSLFAPQGSSPLKRAFFLGFLNRRKFLKYAGATGAVVGASALGLNYISNQSPSSATPTTSTTITHQLTTTSSVSNTSTQTAQLASIQGRLFFDYNGNGVQDEEEPMVAGALVQLKDNVGKVIAEALTDSSGDYALQDVRTGSYKLHVEADKKFRYMGRSPDEFTAVAEDYGIPLQASSTINLGLMEGFLTLPMSPETSFEIDRYYDWDPSAVTYLWWNGKRGTEKSQGGTVNHPGTDYGIRTGSPIVSAAPGVILDLHTSPSNVVFISHGHGWVTSYDHLSKILVRVGQHVSRGEIVGESGATGTTYPHLHFDLRFRDHRCIVDPYSPVFEITPEMSGYLSIVEYGKTVWMQVSLENNPNDGRGQFSKKNDPQYSAL